MGFNLGYLGFAPKGWNSSAKKFFEGTPEQNYQQSTLSEAQQPLFEQLQSATQGRGAGGAFGQAADYNRDILDNNSETINQLNAPELRRFNQEIIPGLAEQFAGMGSGGLSSSGFRNAAVNAGVDLSERLGAIRANLRNQSAQNLQNLGQQGLGNYTENIHRPGTPGFLDTFAKGAGETLGKAAGAYFTGGS